MKKLIFLTQLAIVAILYSSSSFADGGGHRHGHGHGHGWGHHHGHHHGHYYPAPRVTYVYPQPEVHYVYPQPQVNYYQPMPPAPVYRHYDQRSPQGLAGGVIGSVFGYEIGGGDPIATGLGAAAGSYLGNGIGRGY